MPPADLVVGEPAAEAPPIEPSEETQVAELATENESAEVPPVDQTAAESAVAIPPEIIPAADNSRQTIITPPRCAIFSLFPDERRTEFYATMIAGGLVILMFEVVVR